MLLYTSIFITLSIMIFTSWDVEYPLSIGWTHIPIDIKWLRFSGLEEFKGRIRDQVLKWLDDTFDGVVIVANAVPRIRSSASQAVAHLIGNWFGGFDIHISISDSHLLSRDTFMSESGMYWYPHTHEKAPLVTHGSISWIVPNLQMSFLD